MPVYKLTPIDPAAPGWRASRHKGEAIVRAASDEAARALAYYRFRAAVGREDRHAAEPPDFLAGVVTKDELRAGAVETPWRNKALVRCELVDDPRFPQDGPEGVLDPPGHA